MVAEALGKKDFCLESIDGAVTLQNHAYYYQVQMQIFIAGTDFCDFVVQTRNDIHVERIMPDYDLWNKALPKAINFLNSCILPELVGKCFTRPMSLALSVMSEESESDDD